MMRVAVLHGLLLACLQRGSAAEYKGNSYSVQELSQEFPSPTAGDPAHYAPWSQDEYSYPGGGNYVEAEKYAPYPHHSLVNVPRYGRLHPEDGPHYHGTLPSIYTYKPSFTGKDYNEYPHILPPGGKSIKQLQEEADFRLKKIYFESRENNKMVGEKIEKLKDTYGYGTIGYPGYKNTIKYEPIDLGTHNAVDLGTTLDGPGLRLPVQTVTVTKALEVRVPQPYPIRQEVPVPAPFPVPVSQPHFDGNIHPDREANQYPDAFASEFSNGATYSKPGLAIEKNFGFSDSKVENKVVTAAAGTYSNFRPTLGVFPAVRPQISPLRGAYRF